MPARQQYKQASPVTDDDDGLQNNVGAKLLIESQKDELRKRGPRADIAQNHDINGGFGGEADFEKNFADELSSDDGLIAPKKVSSFFVKHYT